MLPPESWREPLYEVLTSESYRVLSEFVDVERIAGTIYPGPDDVFASLACFRPGDTRVVIIGQDPYNREGQAHGLAFSVRPGVPVPPSLVNIFKELNGDLGCSAAGNGCLQPWARQGVLLLNSVLTVRAGQPLSHSGKGWEIVTDAILSTAAAASPGAVFVLWGASARKKRELIEASGGVVLASAHPSPLSARNGFFGSRPFSRANDALISAGMEPIQWCL